MKISRERTILIAVLGVAGIGLLADRVIIGSDMTGPAQSAAGVVDGIDTEPAQTTAATAEEFIKTMVEGQQAPGQSPKQGESLAERLRKVTGSSAVTDLAQARDAFSPAPGWGELPSDSGAVTDNHARQAAETFQSSHVLEAVLVYGDMRYAVIAGQTLSVGQDLDGYRLVSILERTAVFQAQGVRVELGIRADDPPS